MKKMSLTLSLAIIFGVLNCQSRIKDISYFSGLSDMQLVGYGLVIGLDGSGDTGHSQMTVQSIKNMLERFGLTVPMERIRPNNVASVMVTASLPPFMRTGGKFDVVVSSIGNARSLEGGTLLMTSLMGPDGKQYAFAQGPVSIGGFNIEVRDTRTRARKNYTLTGRIPDGAILQQEVYSQLGAQGDLVLNLQNPDFTTAERISVAINDVFENRIAVAENSKSIEINIPEVFTNQNNLVSFISIIENIEIVVEETARVVINERTGTIVAGGNTQISEVVISHGNLVIEIGEQEDTFAFGPIIEQTSTVGLRAQETGPRVMVMQTTTAQDLAQSLNSLRVTPRDLIAIFQSLKTAGALKAELIIM